MARLPFTLQQTPALDRWLTFHEDGTLTICTGKVELGQGISTAIAAICSEELDVGIERIRVQTGDTGRTPDEFVTAGSGSIETSGAAVRQVSAEARAVLLERAALQLRIPLTQLTVENGLIRNRDGNEAISYWQLMAGHRFEMDATGAAEPKPHGSHVVVGQSIRRIDLEGKITGGRAYLQDLELEGMVHGRILRPPSYHARLERLDEAGVRSLPGVLEVMIDGSFVGVVAEREEQALAALEEMKRRARWRQDEALPPQGQLHEFLVANATYSLPVVDGTPVEAPVPELLSDPSAARTVAALYTKPYHMHGSIGPSAAAALWRAEELTVWSHSQGPFVLRGAIAQVLEIDEQRVRVIHRENAGCYGHNGADDAAMDAALLARCVPGRPLMLKWTRDDEHAWEPYSPAMSMRMRADLDASGSILDWNADIFSNTHGGRPGARPGTSQFIAAWHKSDPLPRPEPRPGRGNNSGIHRNADPYYRIPHKRVIKNLVAEAPLRTSSTRGLGAYGNVFAIESFMDELAHAAGRDPVEFRISHLGGDERAIAVIRAAQQAIERNAAARSEVPGIARGRGCAFARYKNDRTYAAVFVDLAIDLATSAIRLIHAAIAADSGQIIDPDGLANQLEGGFIQSASWTLKEQVMWDENGITSRNWESYPILTFPEIPTVEVILLDHPETRSLGAGEATQGPTPAAIANAIFAATGVRMRDIPFTPDRLKEAAAR